MPHQRSISKSYQTGANLGWTGELRPKMFILGAEDQPEANPGTIAQTSGSF